MTSPETDPIIRLINRYLAWVGRHPALSAIVGVAAITAAAFVLCLVIPSGAFG